MNKEMAYLEKIISKGKMHYIFWNGGICVGIPSAIIASIIHHYTGDKPFPEGLWSWLSGFFIGGMIYGLIMWSIINKKYRQQISETTGK